MGLPALFLSEVAGFVGSRESLGHTAMALQYSGAQEIAAAGHQGRSEARSGAEGQEAAPQAACAIEGLPFLAGGFSAF